MAGFHARTTHAPTHPRMHARMHACMHPPVARGKDGDGDDNRHDVEDELHRGEIERHGPVQDPASDDEEGDHKDRNL